MSKNKWGVAICSKCEHRIYDDEKYTRRAFVGSSGNNEAEYSHDKCPTHHLEEIAIITVSKCKECKVEFRSTDNA